MVKYGLSCAYVFHTSNNNNKLWLMRVRLTKQLLDQGFDVLMSDSDALWLQNPFTYINKFEASDIISSRASFPEEVSKKFGATLCMGFIYIKTNARNRALWEELSHVMSSDPRPDDQRSLNKLLMSKGLAFEKRLDYIHTVEADTGSMPSKDGAKTTITLLPHELFRRLCEGFKLSEIHNSIVAHCLLEKTGTAKESGGKKYGIWALKDNWDRNFEPPAPNSNKTINEFLHEISQGRRQLFPSDYDYIARGETERIKLFGNLPSANMLSPETAIAFESFISQEPLTW